jgi:hypothetical protein
MAHRRFDDVTHALASGASRRSVARTVARVLLVGVLGGTAAGVEARKKRRKKKPRPRPCVPGCAGKTCGNDGCGGSCGLCSGNCDQGVCCPGILRNCSGVCQECCDGAYCTGGRICQQGTCVCPSGTKICSDSTCKGCCANGDCTAAFPGQPVGCFDGVCVCFDSRRPCNGVCCEPEETCLLSANPRICAEIVSDRDRKANFASVDPADMLRRVRELPISAWNYRHDDPAIRHIGPMAQDFAGLFGLGDDHRRIHLVDGQGVALAAIQGLAHEIAALRDENRRLASQIQRLEITAEHRTSPP